MKNNKTRFIFICDHTKGFAGTESRVKCRPCYLCQKTFTRRAMTGRNIKSPLLFPRAKCHLTWVIVPLIAWGYGTYNGLPRRDRISYFSAFDLYEFPSPFRSFAPLIHTSGLSDPQSGIKHTHAHKNLCPLVMISSFHGSVATQWRMKIMQILRSV